MLNMLSNIDRRAIYLILMLLVLWPLVKPIGLPISVGPWTMATYDKINTLQPGDMVVMSLDYSVGGSPDVHPQAVAVAKHVLAKGAKIIFMCFVSEGIIFSDEIIKSHEARGKQYGVDFIDVGYLSGGETAIANLASDFYVAFPKDRRGSDTSSLAFLQGWELSKTTMILEFATGNPGPFEWIRQVHNQHHIPMMSGLVAVMAPQTEPYYNAGQLFGVLAGLRGAAEYEIISGMTGNAAAGMDAQSLGHFVIIGFVLLGNLAYFLERSARAKKTGARG